MSEATTMPWTAKSAWPVASGRKGAENGELGVRLHLIEGRPLATLIVRQDRHEALATIVREHFGCELPPAGRASFGPRGDIVWSAPGQWLVVGSAASLHEASADLASFTDQGSSRALVEVSGPAAREALAKGFSIDLHPNVFTSGAVAVTAVAHMSVQIWQTDSAPHFTIAVPRSFAGSFWSWLDHACSPYGYEVAAVSG